MAITQGDPLPDITKTTTTEQQAPDYYTDYLTDLSKAGETALDLTGADLIEGYDPLQTTGYGMVEDAAGSYGRSHGSCGDRWKGFRWNWCHRHQRLL
jgi:hypothetical protein